MKKIITALLLLGTLATGQAQILNPVKFNYSAKKISDNQYELHIKAIIDNKWHLYSTFNPTGGAEPTVITFSGIEKMGKLKENGKLKTVFEKSFGVQQKYFENTVDFVQVVKTKSGVKKVEGSIEYMVCNDNKCLPPKEVPFEIKL